MNGLALRGFTWSSTAADTAIQVLRWAAGPPGAPAGPTGPVPRGSLRQPSAVARSATVSATLGELARTTAARLGAGQAILGDQSPLTLGGAFLATAIGGRDQPEIAERLAALIPAPSTGRLDETGWADALARHAVSGPALAQAGPLTESLLAASPLTNVLAYPGDGRTGHAIDTALGLLSRPHGQQVLVAVISRYTPDARTLGWRARLLNRIAASHPAAVQDIYAAARLRHGSEWDRALQAAAQHLAYSATAGHVDDGAMATVQYWSALQARPVAAAISGALWRDEVNPVRRLLQQYRLTEVSTA
jgi:hypothetical protein